MDAEKTKEKIIKLSDKDLDLLDIMIFQEKARRRHLDERKNTINNKNAFDHQNEQYSNLKTMFDNAWIH